MKVLLEGGTVKVGAIDKKLLRSSTRWRNKTIYSVTAVVFTKYIRTNTKAGMFNTILKCIECVSVVWATEIATKSVGCRN